jgi:uncharacterized protein YjbI with pentapeptide repeats
MTVHSRTQAQGLQQASQTPPRRSSGVMPTFVALIVGIVVGAAASWPLFFGALDRAAPVVEFGLHSLLPVLGVGCAVLALVIPLTWWWLWRFVGTARGTLEQVVREAAAASHAAADRDAPAAASHAERAVLEALAWYGPIAARRWVVQTALALLVTFGGLIGTALLFRQTLLLGEQNAKLQEQTGLLRDQNSKIDLQTVTAEAQRRAGLAAEMSAILQVVSNLRVVPIDMLAPTGASQIPDALIGRIVAFSRAATPYWVAEVPERPRDGEAPKPRLADRARSPERGQLLLGLVLANVDIPALARAGAYFGGAGLGGAILNGANLSGANLGDADLVSADLRDASLIGANLRSANLKDANLRSANLNGANLRGVDLVGADLRGANLGDVDLVGADLSGANLGNVDLAGANLLGANLTGANLSGASLSPAFMRNASLRRANLIGANLNGADLAGADLSDVIISLAPLLPGQLPVGFPIGWSAPPPGLELFEEQGFVRLRRSITPPPAAPASR